MTRGPRPKKAISVALAVAGQRGMTILCDLGKGSVCDLVICGAGYTAMVRVKRSRRIHCPLSEIVVQFAEAIACLRLVPVSANRCRELWICGEYGTLRFFRVGDQGIVEIDRDGIPIEGGDGGM